MAKILQTPLMKQYEEMKRKHPDAVLLFRVGELAIAQVRLHSAMLKQV